MSSLPPMLSPTLPPWTDCVQVEFPKMLSPTLPAVFDFGSKKTNTKTGLSHEMKDKSFPVTLKVSKKVLSRLDARTDEDTPESKPNGRREEARANRIPPARDLDKSTTPTKAKSKGVSPTRDDETKQQFKLVRTKMRTWLDLARTKKHLSDAKFQAEEYALASAAAMDSLLCYIIGFNYEERADRLMGRLPHEKSWTTLVNFVNRVNFLHEASKQTHLVACCHLLRALIHVRIGLVLGAQIKAHARDSESEGDPEALALSLLRTQEGYTADFRRANRSLPLSALSQSFPKSYARRSKTATPVVHDGGYRPWSDEYALPLHVYSSLQEAAALGWNMTDEWIRGEGLKYEWACRALA
ncbi:hypothetical protein CJU89_4959 [Yarrowia sp. B02]|nr:hypothetical protein CJU89_4959 [Yarrowia sp. B02]